MEAILCLYKENKTLINFIKDAVYFLGAFTLIKYLWNRNYLRKTGQIESNLQFRGRIEVALDDYVIEKNKNRIKDIGVRFVHWKNYSRSLQSDGFKHLLKVEYHHDQLLLSSWIDNTGIYFQEHLWFTSSSVYIDANDIFFFGPGDQNHKGFTEHKNKRLIVHLPFTNIVNFDFREYIEYEPVFYIKYPYTSYRKLYSRYYEIREKSGEDYSICKLDRKKQLSRYSWIGHNIKKVSSKCFWDK